MALLACVRDTTIASFLLESRPELSAYTSYLDEQTVIYLSFQTVAEMKFGAVWKNWGGRKKERLKRFFSSSLVISYTEDLADHWAIMMQEARQAGRRLEAGDAWIAATARLLDLPLLTHDNDFSPAACPSITVYSHCPRS